MNLNKNFVAFLTILGVSLYALNLCHKTACCALAFTAIMLIIKTMHDKFGAKKTFISLSLLSLINIITSHNYYLNQQMISNLVAVSMMAVFTAAFLGNLIAKKFTTANASTNVLYFAIGALIDSIVMAAFLLSNFSVSKVASIFLIDISYKIFYLILTVVLAQLIRNLSVKQNYLKNNIAS